MDRRRGMRLGFLGFSLLSAAAIASACGDDAASPGASSDGGQADTSARSDASTTPPADGAADAVSATDAGSDGAADAGVVCRYVDWTAVDAGNGASGTLGTTSVALSGTGVISAIFDGGSTEFTNATLYVPPIASGDHVWINGATTPLTYTLTFGAPVSGVRFYLRSFASVMTFPSGTTLTKVSGDGAGLGIDASVLSGVLDDTTAPGYDRNGIVAVAGTVTSITFTVAYPGVDGIHIQVQACR